MNSPPPPPPPVPHRGDQSGASLSKPTSGFVRMVCYSINTHTRWTKKEHKHLHAERASTESLFRDHITTFRCLQPKNRLHFFFLTPGVSLPVPGGRLNLLVNGALSSRICEWKRQCTAWSFLGSYTVTIGSGVSIQRTSGVTKLYLFSFFSFFLFFFVWVLVSSPADNVPCWTD